MRLLLGGLAAIVALVPSRPADACSCAGVPGLLVPTSGATGVARDVQIYYRPALEEPWDELPEVHLALRLGDVLVDAQVESRNGVDVLTPLAPLEAGKAYTILDGEAVAGTFTVGENEIETAPAAPVIRSLVYQHAPLAGEPSSCNEQALGHAALDMVEDPDAVAYLATVDGGGQRMFLPDEVHGLYAPESIACGRTQPYFLDDTQLCLRLQAIGADGQLSAPAETCAARQECAPLTWEDDFVCASPESDGCSVGADGRGSSAGAWLLLGALALVRRRRAGGA